MEQAALRETEEEIGVKCVLEKYVGFIGFEIDGKEFQSHMFLSIIPDGQEPKPMEEKYHSKLMWLSIQEYKKFPLASNAKKFCENFIEGKYNL